MKPSRRCVIARHHPLHLQVRDVADALGLSEATVRRTFVAHEWHHADIPAHPERRQVFYRWPEIQRHVQSDVRLQQRVQRRQLQHPHTMPIALLLLWDFSEGIAPLPFAIPYSPLPRAIKRQLRLIVPKRGYLWWNNRYWMIPTAGRLPWEWVVTGLPHLAAGDRQGPSRCPEVSAP